MSWVEEMASCVGLHLIYSEKRIKTGINGIVEGWAGKAQWGDEIFFSSLIQGVMDVMSFKLHKIENNNDISF